MAARILDGKKVAADIKGELKTQVEALHARGVVPALGVILVGEDPGSVVYVRNKEKACQEIGLESRVVRLPESVSQAAVLAQIAEWNRDPAVHGILVQLPLPTQISDRLVISAVSPDKDVDCFHPENVGRLLVGDPFFLPCTPAGILELLARYDIQVDGAHVVIIGRSNIVGKPLANLLFQKRPGSNATVTVCHTGTRDLIAHVRRADILVAALGRPEFVRGTWLHPGAVVVDVGTNRIPAPETPQGTRLVGDVHFESASEMASAISPVPGGVGPLTVAMLMANTVKAALGSERERVEP